jgi:hypothetical protein
MEGSPIAKEDQDISREMGERLSLPELTSFFFHFL